MNEFTLIKKIRRLVPSPGKEVIKGIGDDTAVLSGDKKSYLLFTCDILVEKVHFSLDYTPLPSLGWKALAASASDIAAMGGIPESALVSLALPKKDAQRVITQLYQGIKEFCSSFSINIVGGNVSYSEKLIIDVAMLGKVEKQKLILREGAKAGDFIVVTGTLGDSSAGLEILKKGGNETTYPFLVHRHLQPHPRTKEIRKIISSVQINSLIDISDGLTQDLFHLLEESKVVATLQLSQIPISSQLRKYAGKKSLNYALGGGEDYELLFTLSAKERGKLPSKVKGTPLTIIGQIISGKPKILADGKEIKPQGYDHFK